MKLYSAEEVAEILQVEKETVWKWIRAGKIKSVNIGRLVRITQEEVERITNEGVK